MAPQWQVDLRGLSAILIECQNWAEWNKKARICYCWEGKGRLSGSWEFCLNLSHGLKRITWCHLLEANPQGHLMSTTLNSPKSINPADSTRHVTQSHVSITTWLTPKLSLNLLIKSHIIGVTSTSNDEHAATDQKCMAKSTQSVPKHPTQTYLLAARPYESILPSLV